MRCSSIFQKTRKWQCVAVAWSVMLVCQTRLPQADLQAADAAQIEKSRRLAVEFLRTSQSEDGSWTDNQSPGITALVTAALLRSGAKTEDPMVQKALAFLTTFVRDDGGIYTTTGNHGNYETSISLLAFHAANKDGRYDKLIPKALEYLKKVQWGEANGIKADDIKFGGAGYGRTQDRPDLSNTSFLLDALKTAGVGKDDPAMKNALIFVSRCQNLESQTKASQQR